MPESHSFEQVYAEHFRFVWRTLRRLGVSPNDVPDAVQDVFLVVHRKLRDWEGRSKLTTWLFGICLRVAGDRRKTARHRQEVVLEELPERCDDGAGVGELLDERTRAELLEAVLQELPLEQRAVFALFELEEIDGGQIAELLDIPLGTVWSRLRLAREAFRTALRRRMCKQNSDQALARSGT